MLNNHIVRNVQDRVLIIKTRAGNEESYAHIYDRYFKDIYTFVFYKVSSREVAEDLAADVFLKVWHAIREGVEVDNLRAFLYTIARNLTIDHYRKQKEVALNQTHEETLVSDIQSPDEVAELELSKVKLNKALGQLKDEYREVIIMRHIQGLSHKEIATVLGKSSGTVRVLVHRAMEQLKNMLV
jgi:RNA polymerase sigma factor (sigma-70 family)